MTDEQARQLADQLRDMHATLKLIFWALCGLIGATFGLLVGS